MLENVAGREPQLALFLHVRFPSLSDDLLTSRTAGEIPKAVQFGRHERERVGTECIVAMDSPRVAPHGGALIAFNYDYILVCVCYEQQSALPSAKGTEVLSHLKPGRCTQVRKALLKGFAKGFQDNRVSRNRILFCVNTVKMGKVQTEIARWRPTRSCIDQVDTGPLCGACRSVKIGNKKRKRVEL